MVDTSTNNADLIRQKMANIRREIERLEQQLKGMQLALEIVEATPQPRGVQPPDKGFR